MYLRCSNLKASNAWPIRLPRKQLPAFSKLPLNLRPSMPAVLCSAEACANKRPVGSLRVSHRLLTAKRNESRLSGQSHPTYKRSPHKPTPGLTDSHNTLHTLPTAQPLISQNPDNLISYTSGLNQNTRGDDNTKLHAGIAIERVAAAVSTGTVMACIPLQSPMCVTAFSDPTHSTLSEFRVLCTTCVR